MKNINTIYNTQTRIMSKIIIVSIIILIALNSGIKEKVFNSIKGNVMDQLSQSDTANNIRYLNTSANESIKAIDEITGENTSEDVKALAKEAVAEYNRKMNQVADGSYNAKEELKNITSTGVNAAKEINDTANVVSNEDIDKAKEELTEIATDKINKVQNGEFNATEEMNTITEKGKESLNTINQAGKESIESLNENTKDLQKNEKVKEVIKNVKNDNTVKELINTIKEKITEVF